MDSVTVGRRMATGRLSPRLKRVLLTFHLLTAVGLVGIAVVLWVLGIGGLTGANPEIIYPAMHLVARAALTPLIILALGIGVAQALLLGYGLLQHWWVATKLVILTLLTLVAVVVVVPGLGRAADAATTPGDEVTIAQQITSTVTPAVALALFVLAAFLGVFKPGSRRE